MKYLNREAFIDNGVTRVLTQYRESPKILFLLRTYLGQVWDAYSPLLDLENYFNLDTAVGDQLTIIGKWMGFPRCHCVCDVQPVFGFACAGVEQTIVGFCESGTWANCDSNGLSEICVNDDNAYRALLVSRALQIDSRYSLADLTLALQTIYGPTARVMDEGFGQVVLAPFRELGDDEIALLPIVARVLPIAPGMVSRWHFGLNEVFGFGIGWGGFCEPFEPNGLPLTTEDGIMLTTETGVPISTGPLTQDADWLCRIDLKPYSC